MLFIELHRKRGHVYRAAPEKYLLSGAEWPTGGQKGYQSLGENAWKPAHRHVRYDLGRCPDTVPTIKCGMAPNHMGCLTVVGCTFNRGSPFRDPNYDCGISNSILQINMIHY